MATSPIYKTSNEAGTEARRKGKAIQTGKYEPGAFTRQAIGKEYVPGEYSSAQIGQDYRPGVLADQAMASGIPSPSPRRRGIAPSPSGPSADVTYDPLKSYQESILRDQPQSELRTSKPEGNFLGDSANDLAIGGLQLYGAGYEIANLVSGGAIDQAIKERTGKTGTENLAEARQRLQEDQSPALRAQRKELEDAKGFVDSFSAVITNPRLAGSMVVQMAPQLATIGMAARAVAMKTLAWGAEAGLTAEAAQAAAATNATRTVMGLNAVMEGGMAGADTRSHILNMKEDDLLKSPQYQALLKSGMEPYLARQKLANDASLISTALAGSISAVASKLTGAASLEAAVLGRVANKVEQEVGKRAGMTVAKEVGFGAVKETAEETLQEGGSQFAQNVAEQQKIDAEKSLLEGVPEAAGAGGAMGLLAGGGFGGAKAAMDKAAEAITPSPSGTTGQAYSGPGAGRLTDVEMVSAARSPAFMAYQYSVADDATRTRLQNANPNLNLSALAADVDLVAQGKRISDSAPRFGPTFLNQLEEFDLQTAQAAAEQVQRVAGAPSMEGVKAAADLGMQEAGEGILGTPPASTEEELQDYETGVRQISDMPMEEQINRLRGYRRRAQNLERLPENYRRDQAELSVQEMVDQGFPETVARGVFGGLLYGPSLETVLQEGGHTASQEPAGEVESVGGTPIATEAPVVQEAPPEPVTEVMSQFGDMRMSDGTMTDDQFRDALVNWDNRRQGTDGKSTRSDYDIIPLPAPMQKLADALGIQLKAWSWRGEPGRFISRRQGISMGGSVIGINMGSTSTGGEFVVFGHELFHELAKRDRQAGDKLIAAMQDYLDGDITAELRQKLREVGYKEDILAEEIVADVLGVLFTENSFWQKMAVQQPTLLEKIIDIVRQMIQRMSQFGTREKMVQKAIKDLQKVEDMMVKFLNDAINKQSAGTSIEDNIQLNATQAEALQNVRSLLKEGKRSEAAAAFKSANLWKETGMNFNEIEAQEVAPVVEEPEVPMRRPQEEVDAENAYRAMLETVDLLRAGQTAKAAQVFKAGNLSAFGENFVELSKQIASERKKRISEAQFQSEEQKRLALKSKRSMFDRQIEDVTSGVTKRVEEMVKQRKDLAIAGARAFRESQTQERAAALIGEGKQRGMLTDDTGGVMTQMAELGMYGGAEAQAEAAEKRTKAEEARAESDRLAEENAAIHNNRVRALLYNADRGLDQLAKIRQEMAAVGYSSTEIEAAVGKSEADLKSLRDGELRKLAEEQLRDAKNLGQREVVSRVEPEEYPGFNEIQAELAFNDDQRRNALALVDAIERKEMSMDDALKAIKINKIGQMQLYDAMRQRGVPVPKSWIDISGNIAVNYSLNDWVKGFPNSAMAARDAWFRAVDAVPEGVVDLTDGEMVSYRNWKKQTTELRNRLKDQGATFDSLENAFPHALPLNYTLNEMRNPDSIPEGDRRQMIKMEFDDPVRAWFKDVQYIEQSRPDIANQFDNYLTKAEQEAYKEFKEREDSEARRAVEMKTKSALYSQIDGLRFLSPKIYTDFRSQISQAEEHQLAAIMQAAFEANEFAQNAIANGADIETIGALMDARAMEDQGVATSADEISSEEEIDDDGNYVGYDDSIRFKRGTNSPVLSALNVIESATLMFKSWKDKPNYTVVQNPNQLPNDVRARIQPSFAASGFKAATDPKTGHMYLFSDFLEGDTDTQFAVFNEIYGQWGVRGFMGDSFKTFLENQYRLNRKTITAADKLIEERRAMGIPTSIPEATYAVLGETAIHTVHTKFANWLDKNGFPAVANWIKSSTNSEVSGILSGITAAAKSNGISPLGGMPNDSISFDRKKMPVEGYAYRGGEITAYARVNPITGDWIVFTLKDGAKSINEGEYTITTTDDLQIAHNMMKQYGTVRLARARETLRYIGPDNIEKIKTWNEDDSWWTKTKRWVIQGAQNRFLPIWEVAQQLSMAGKDNTVIDDLVKYESRTGYYIDNYKRRYMQPIMKILRRLDSKYGMTIEDVDLFLMARHAKERNEMISAINPDNKKGSGLTTAEAQKILDKRNNGAWDVAAMQELEMIGRLMDQMSSDKINYLLQTGMISKYQYEALKRYKHYVNLSGNTETDLDKYDATQLGGRAFNVRGSDIIRSTGRGTVAVDVLQNTMNAYVATLIRGQKNKPLQAILDMFEQNPDKTYVEVNPIETVQRVDVEKFNFDNKIMKILGTDKDDVKAGKNFLVGLKERMKRGEIDSDDALAEIAQRIREAEERRAIQPDEAARALRNLNEQVVMSARLSPDGYVSTVEVSGRRDPQEVIVKVNGKSISMVFKQGALPFFQAITGMNIQKSNAFFEGLSKWATFFSQMVTTWNPAWIPINMFRDIQTAFSNMAADPEVGAGLAKKMIKEYGRSLKIATRYKLYDWAGMTDGRFRTWVNGMQNKYPMDEAQRKLIDEFFEDGAGTYFLDRDNVEMSLKKLQDAMNANKGGVGMTKAAWEEYTAMMDLVGMSVEIAPRLAAYTVLRNAGKSREVAARYAKELTVNFNMKGTSRELRAAYVFFNPAVQGTVRMFKDLRAGNFGRFGATASFWMGLGFLSTMIARALSGDDEDRPGIDSIDMVASYKRNTSLTWMPGVVGGSIPVAYGWNVFSAAGQYMYDVVHGHMPVGTAAMKTMAAAFDSFSPIGSGAESKTLTGSVLKTATPSIAMPVVEWNMNENRFGAPIYKEQSPYSDIKEANAYMHFDSVNPISKWAMQSLAEVGTSKNARYTPGMVDVNPAMVDHFINSYLPGMFSEAYKSAGLAIKKGRGEDTKDMPVPLLDRFKAKAEPEGFDASAVRNLKVTIDTMWEAWKQPDTTAEEKAQMKRDYPELAKLKALSQANEQAIKSARQSAAKLERDPKVSDEYKVEVRNRVKALEEGYNARLIKRALDAGWRDTILYGEGEPSPPR